MWCVSFSAGGGYSGETKGRKHDESFHDGPKVEELYDDPETGDILDDIKISDAKIRKWLNGKEGNIRSLLSTLQYVLWPGSGWKPVPLMAIIEGSAVKRAYQKALLCLHPDKLQQKGAASHQKYVAERVFDVLQSSIHITGSVGAFQFTWRNVNVQCSDARWHKRGIGVVCAVIVK
ncbi:hypothetical protein RHGRI_016098 [Rhododendron griersonianum]|uniref:J domain-containing protein n=1 Tax=Rhododendron griersonianum TaxID=479676 RepID=A0AAV6JSN6_9ERIC|nr:hypothetical protein RHGRI_016098 [Rhododendron griersonianum]